MRSATVLLALVATASTARAEDPPFDAALDLQLFEYAVGPKSFFSVPSAEIAEHMQFQVDMMLTYLTRPLVVFGFDEETGELLDERTGVVDSVLAGQLGGAIGFRNKFQFGVALPLIFTLAGDGLDPSTGNMSPGGLRATGLGDLRGEAKMRLLESGGVTLSALGQISLPTSFGSGGSMFLGDNTPSARASGVVQWRSASRKITAGASAGLLLRKPRQIYDTEIGQQLLYGLATSYRVHERVELTGETFGRLGASLSAESSPLEVVAGARLSATESISVVAGGGAGVVAGIGSPGLRMFLSVGFAPDLRDQDGDGVANNRDRCPLLAEDLDGFEDSDGCPEPDNDGDMRMDVDDKCPLEAEDLDGFQDEDGCPEADNDDDGMLDADDGCPSDAEDGLGPRAKDGCPATVTDYDDDGVKDAFDKCPMDPEDADAFEDEDGCPEPDNDLDGVLDEDDQCPACAEDRDGFEDEDGCPDPDNDQDGIADAIDQCPLEAEVINGVDDEDGCPDSGGRAIASFDGDKVEISSPITFSSSGALRATKVVDQVANVMRAAVLVSKWRIVIVAKPKSDPEEHRAASQGQADALKAALEERGVTAEIEAIGAAADRALTAIIVLEKAAPKTGCSE